MKTILYSTNCPKCNILEKKLKSEGIEFEVVNDAQIMIDKGFEEAPQLEVDGKTMNFMEAISWINNK